MNKMRSKYASFNVVWIMDSFFATICFSSHGNCHKQKFLEMDVLVEGLSLEVPIYVVMEGYEPPFFTRFFLWDHSKANVSLLRSKL